MLFLPTFSTPASLATQRLFANFKPDNISDSGIS